MRTPRAVGSELDDVVGMLSPCGGRAASAGPGRGQVEEAGNRGPQQRQGRSRAPAWKDRGKGEVVSGQTLSAEMILLRSGHCHRA